MSTLNALPTSCRGVEALASFAHRVSEPRNTKRFLFHGLAVLVMCLGIAASGQIPSVTDVTAPPTPGVGHDYIQENVETVNPSNGSLSVRIGVPLPKSRGVNIPFGFAYDSGSAYFLSQNINSGYSGFQWWSSATPFSQGGWSYSVPMLSVQDTPFFGTNQYVFGYTDVAITCQMWTDYVFQDASGQRTNLGISFPENNQNGCNSNNFPGQVQPNYDSPTGTGITLPVGAATLISQVGSTIAVTDPNWSSEATVNAVDVINEDGTDYHFNMLQAPSYGGINGRWGQVTGIAPPSSITDRNGNTAQLVLGVPGQPALKYIDTIGRTSLSISSFGSNTSPDILTVSGLNQTYKVNWTSAGANFPITMTNLAQFDGYTACDPSNGSPANGGGNQPVVDVISLIALPNGQQYGFRYDPTYGLISQINYPTGGYVIYSWGLNTQSEYGLFTNYTQKPVTDPTSGVPTGQTYPSPTGGCAWHYDSPAIQHRYVYNVGDNVGQNGGPGPNGGYLVEQQDFTYSTTWNSALPKYWTQKQTTVVTHDFVQGTTFQTVYIYGSVMSDFQPQANVTQSQIPVESTIQHYGANGVLLQTVNKTWANQRLMTQQTTTLANGQVSETDMAYNCNEMMSEKDEYGFGAGSEIQTPPSGCPFYSSYASGSAPRGPLLRKTLIPSYHTFSQSILDKPDEVEVEDGSSNVVAGVSYHYDLNGNMLSRSDWLNQTGTSALTTSHTYDPYGNMQTTTDPKKNITTYVYSDAFVDNCSLPSPANVYLTKITYPTPSSGAQLVKSFQYHCATGDLATSKDENQKVTSYIYNTPPSDCATADGLDRLSEIDYPDGGKTTHCYSDVAPNPTVVTKMLMSNPNGFKVAQSTLDGLGQAIRSQVSNTDDGGDIYVDTVYDGMGHVNSVSNPYRSTAETTYGLTKNTYDALGRPMTTMHPDGSSSAWCYDGVASAAGAMNCSPQVGSATTGTWVDSTDENGNHWQRTSDALGRLTQVMELGSSAILLSLETDYGYDALGNLLLVNQKGNGSTDTARIRKFSYDSVSRLIAVSNPETSSTAKPPSLGCTGASGSSWTTCYGYDQNGNLAFKTDNRGITASFSYDTLNRVLNKTYSDRSTPSSCYQYDSMSVTNGVGRLASIWTLSASSGASCPAVTPFLTKRSILNYDAMGRILSEKQFTLANQVNGYAPAYTYDLAGNLLTSTSGVAPAATVSPISITNTYSSAGRLQAVTSNVASNWTNGTFLPSTLFALPPAQNTSCTGQAAQYTAFGGLQNASFGIGASNVPAFTLNRNYDMRLRTTCENDIRPSATPSTPGSVVVTISGSEQPQ